MQNFKADLLLTEEESLYIKDISFVLTEINETTPTNEDIAREILHRAMSVQTEVSAITSINVNNSNYVYIGTIKEFFDEAGSNVSKYLRGYSEKEVLNVLQNIEYLRRKIKNNQETTQQDNKLFYELWRLCNPKLIHRLKGIPKSLMKELINSPVES